MKNFLILPIAILTALLFNNCALIFIPKNQKNVEFVTKNENAEVYVDNLLEGEGKKVVVQKLKKTGAKQVTVRVPLHKDANYVLMPQKKNPAYL